MERVRLEVHVPRRAYHRELGGVNLNQECASEYGSGAYAGYLDYNKPLLLALLPLKTATLPEVQGPWVVEG